MVNIHKFFSAFAAELRRPATVRVGKAVLVFLVLFSLLTVQVVAESSTIRFHLNDLTSVVPSSVSATAHPFYPTYDLVSSYMIQPGAEQYEVFPFSDPGFLFEFRSVSSHYVSSFVPSVSFNLPITSGFSDEEYLVFSIATGLSTFEEPYIPYSFADDAAIYVNDQHFKPSKFSEDEKGIYYTFAIDIDMLGSDSVLTVQPIFQDFIPLDLEHSESNFPAQVNWFIQFSPLVYTSSKSAAASYAASIDTLLKNDIQPTLDNISQVQNVILSEVENLDVKIEGSVSNALTSLVDRLDSQTNSAVSSVVDLLQSKVDLDLVAALYSSFQMFFDAFTGNHVEFKLTFPAITIPDIAGIIPGCQISDEYIFDFQNVFDILPPLFILLVRYFCTFSLIVFVVKDFLDTINSLVSGDNLHGMTGLETFSKINK